MKHQNATIAIWNVPETNGMESCGWKQPLIAKIISIFRHRFTCWNRHGEIHWVSRRLRAQHAVVCAVQVAIWSQPTWFGHERNCNNWTCVFVDDDSWHRAFEPGECFGHVLAIFVSIVNFKLGMSDITLTLLLHGNKMKNSSVKNVFLSKCFFVGASLCGFNFRTLNLVREVIAFY